MDSALMAKLARMRRADAPPAPSRGGFRTYETAYPLPDGLFSLSEGPALSRLGVDFPWPGVHRLLFLDTETTGLSRGAGTIAFLIGLGRIEGDRFLVTQYELRDYPGEPDMLRQIAAQCRAFDALVSFNGRTYDWPLLETRFALNRLRDEAPRLPHLDLLPTARNLFKRRLGSVRLSILEREVLRAGRTDDLPGAEAPARFFAYIQSGEDAGLAPVRAHNAQDVYALVQLLVAFYRVLEQPASQAEIADLYSLGRLFERRGEMTEALALYRLATLPRPLTSVTALREARHARDALYAQACLQKRLGDVTGACESLRSLCRASPGNTRAAVALSKLCEHALHEPAEALQWTRQALQHASSPRELSELSRRANRLSRKIPSK